MLLAVAHRLAGACEGCHLARVDGDSFGMLGPKSRLAPDRLLCLFETPFAAGEQQLQIEVQFGYCRIAGSERGETLYKRADMALTHARLTRHTRYLHFTPKIEKRTRWRLDVIRVDRSFVEEIDSGRCDVFAETIVALAHKLGMETVAEGVATRGQLARLRELGCTIAQGFLYAKPTPPDALIKWMGTHPVGLAH